MKSKKLILAEILHRTNLLNTLRATSRDRLIVFNYHRIRNFKKKEVADFDDGVFGPTVEQFGQQMLWLKQNSEIIGEKKLLSCLLNNKKLAHITSMVTFDDGYIDNYTLAYPILKSLEIPAIFFIPTEHITTRQLGWWDIISYLVKRTQKEDVILDGVQVPLNNTNEAIHLILKKKKLEPYEKTKDLIIRLAAACEVALPDRERQHNELMTWDHIREVFQNGIAIGSHTHSHNVLATLRLTDQRNEMSASKKILEHEIGSVVESISYPVGNYQHFSSETQVIAAECGYKLGFSFNTGVNYNHEIQRFDIRRVESEGAIEMFAGMTLLPRIFV